MEAVTRDNKLAVFLAMSPEERGDNADPGSCASQDGGASQGQEAATEWPTAQSSNEESWWTGGWAADGGWSTDWWDGNEGWSSGGAGANGPWPSSGDDWHWGGGQGGWRWTSEGWSWSDDRGSETWWTAACSSGEPPCKKARLG